MGLLAVERRDGRYRAVEYGVRVAAACREARVRGATVCAATREAAEEVRAREAAAAKERQCRGCGERQHDPATRGHPGDQSIASTRHRPSVASSDRTRVPP